MNTANLDPVSWLRAATPYIDAHRNATFVVHVAASIAAGEALASLCTDLALLHALGVRLHIVYGIDVRRDATTVADPGTGATRRALTREFIHHALAVSGVIDSRFESALMLTRGLTSHTSKRLRISRGNFVVAKPAGIVAGLDLERAGTVRRVDGQGIESVLASGHLILCSPLAHDLNGTCFLLESEAVAADVAVTLSANKLITLTEGGGAPGPSLPLPDPGTPAQVSVEDARSLARRMNGESEQLASALRASASACEGGVERAHIIDYSDPRALLTELFTRDGQGTMVHVDSYDRIRPASPDDVPGIVSLIAPLQRSGALAARNASEILADIDRFLVMERDGAVIGTVAAFEYPAEAKLELACLAVSKRYQRAERGDALLRHIEQRARERGLKEIVVLTTATQQWFEERGFAACSIEALPSARRVRYDPARGSRVLRKTID